MTRVAELRTRIVAVPQRRPYPSSWRRSYQGSAPQLAVLVELVCDDGVCGVGEAPVVWAGRPEATVALIDAVRELVVGSDPLQHDVTRRRIQAETGIAHLGARGLSWALSGIDVAFWDLAGKLAGQPLHRLWGGAWRDRSPFHADLPPSAPERMAEDAAEWVERGFRTLYLKVGFDDDLDVARVRAVREAVGEGPRIRVDANQSWSPATARRVVGRLAEYGLEYVEQPTSAANLDEMAVVRGLLPVPVLAHEASLTVDGSLQVIARQAADALQLDPRFDDGLAGARTAALAAEAAGLPVVTHTFGELGVGTAAMLQLHAAHRNFVLDNQTYYPNLTDDVIAGGLLRFDGCELAVPTGPGLGVELDRDRVAHYAQLWEQEWRDRPRAAPDDPFYERRYLVRPR
jgi:L-alanine-DL-glutamate epimerase-like enolase superfamily enzyme